ncbi:hypothetical protein ACOMDM_21985 [Serratia plymuthica]|uniref:Uncharacterized protein n=1 Tax=Serratia plymuthica TaxID=82996 RepID=A0A318NWN6_SERPL|nr:hypothetical protein [Serratia plymuthica]AGO56994.1 hypothetical protein SOD_c40440 [Serratia plymuthica 4Rx13]AHY09951.1 hypothetical protein sch_22730 [Serratia plymuthica]MBL3522617.1 hypothetical protein [Serratia plymuthica]MEB6540844.1 hypothetical protein [Serratia plymuthica]PYD38174.1 hypothetical protein CT690_14925 [Serratia plymuthica]
MKRFCKTVMLPVITGIVFWGPSDTGAVTREEMFKLNAAYPPGSFTICESKLEGNGKDLMPMLAKIRGHIIDRKDNLSHSDVSVMFIPQGASTASLTLSYRQTVTMEDNGQWAHIDPDSLKVSMPANPASEAILAEGFRNRLPTGKELQPYQTTEITDFPSYVVRIPGESPLYCHKETSGE